MGGGASQRFSTLVFSITTDAANLYDHETGIMVEGALREEHMAGLEPGAKAEWHYPANYNARGRAWERPANVSVFTPEGTCVVSQAVGLRLAGGGSRQFEQKSLRLVAREEYQPGMGKFRYNFFPQQADDMYGSPITAYDSLVLRNGGNDRYFAQLRNELGCRLAAEAGYAAVSPGVAAAVYLNGEYYGFAWLQESLNEQALEDIYDAPEPAFEFADLAEANVRADGTVLERQQPPALDLDDPEQFELYQSLVDVEDLLFYYAFQIYTGNIDWPGNNVKLWRYTGGAGAAHPALDGRWRHVLYDLDTIAGFDDLLTWDAPTLDDLLGTGDEYRQSPLLGALLARPELAAEFAARMCELADCHLLIIT